MIDYVIDDCLSVASHSSSQNPAILIFASHKRFGGGYKNHSKTQEEWCFNKNTLPQYGGNKSVVRKFYPLSHDEADGFILPATIKKSQRTVKFIFVPAPAWVLENDFRTDKELVLRNRAKIIFELAAEHNVDHLILGGWGCRIFGCPPDLVARILKELTPSSLRITYAFRDSTLMETFKKVQK